MIYGTPPNEHEIKYYAVQMRRSLDLMERWLTDSPYLCGNEITIADLAGACEVIQGRFIELDFKKWPNVQAWMEKIIFGIPEVHEITKPILKLAEISVKKGKHLEEPKL